MISGIRITHLVLVSVAGGAQAVDAVQVHVSAFDVPGFQLQPEPEPPVAKLMMMSVR